MTIEEIVKQEGRQPDCSGYVTKYDIECSDGLTIRQGAFDDDNGRKVPMVWMHDHKDMENVLGHIYLESRDDGVYGLGYFNDSPKGQLAKLYVDHGDISAFSIYANKLKKKAKDVVHGMIREVSLVLAGANRGALIDSPISHSEKEEDEGEGVICMGDDYGGPIYGNDEALSVEEYLEHYGRKGMKWGKNLFKTEYEAHPREKKEDEETNSNDSKTDDPSHGMVSREKNVTGEGNKVETGESVEGGAANESNAYTNNSEILMKKYGNWAANYAQYYDAIASKYDAVFADAVFNNLSHMDIQATIDSSAHAAGGIALSDVVLSGKNLGKEKNVPPYLAEAWNTQIDDILDCAYAFISSDDDEEATEQAKAYLEYMHEVSKIYAALYNLEDEDAYYNFMIGVICGEYGYVPEQNIYQGTGFTTVDQVKENQKFVDDFNGKKSETVTNLVGKVKDTAGKIIKEVGQKIKDFTSNLINNVSDWLASLKHFDSANDYISHMIGESIMDENFEHSENEGGRTVHDVFNDMTDEQKSVVYYCMLKARQALEDGTIAKHSDEEGEKEVLEHSDKEEDEMKKNVFDDATENKENTLSHADMEKLEADVFKDAKAKGSLKDSFLAHAGDYGIDDIEYLFPDDRKVTNTPTWIKRPDGWVSKVMKGVSHSPFSRIKSIFADITEPDARARGYVKGNKKVEEVFGLLKRSTTPTTVYKKQKLDRDDIIDITDFDVVSWLKTEMRGMLDEELARAFLIGDGRSTASNDKINEQNIRPIYTDDDLFVIRKAIAVTSSTTTDAKCKEFIRQCIKARKDYRGSGNPTLFTTEDLLTDMLLMEDGLGHPLYDSQDKLATKLRVKEIVTVPVFENQTRIVGTATMELMGIIVNLDDYKVGADKGGSVSMFEDFDIDYNQEKYLIETRCSGALTVPYSAIVIESSASVYLDVDPDDPTETRYGKTVSSLQDNVVINDDSISGTLKYVTGYTGFSGDTALQSGHYLALKLDVPNGATTTLQLLNNGGSGTPVDLGSDDYAVGYIRSKNAKIVITTTLAGVSVSKTYSLRLLKLESAS